MIKFLTSLLCASTLLALASVASAENEPPEQISQPAQDELKLLELVRPGETVEPGDLVKVERRFDTWSLYCDTRLSINKRICSIQEYISNENGFLLWSLKPTNKGSALVFVVPSNLDKANGLRVDFGLEKTIPAENWICTDKCIAVVPFDGLLQAAIASVESVKFVFSVTDDGTTKTINLVGSMKGFPKAVFAASQDPFGKAAQIEQLKKKSPIATEDPKQKSDSEGKSVDQAQDKQSTKKASKASKDKKAEGLY